MHAFSRRNSSHTNSSVDDTSGDCGSALAEADSPYEKQDASIVAEQLESLMAELDEPVGSKKEESSHNLESHRKMLSELARTPMQHVHAVAQAIDDLAFGAKHDGDGAAPKTKSSFRHTRTSPRHMQRFEDQIRHVWLEFEIELMMMTNSSDGHKMDALRGLIARFESLMMQASAAQGELSLD
ncbi:MAG: hypothetical protein FWE46_01595 [Coriobacteriia bacterium]|nr:hypothetical protein [Coriobacteriia bacterium]MCL2536872.1 hypothetical protein [Coriobacteriia bacterium]